MCAPILFSLVAGSCTAAAPGSKDAPPKPSPLVGEWEIVTETLGGRVHPPEFGTVVFVFKADGRHGNRRTDQAEPAQWHRYRADDKADPPALDILIGGGHPRKGATMQWLYRVDGDTLTRCTGPDDTRPKAFEAGRGSKNKILTLKRVKPKD